MRQGKSISRFVVGKTSGIKIQFVSFIFCPINPTLEMFYFNLVTIYFFSTKISIQSMQIHSVFARNQRHCFVDVGT